LRRSVRAPLFGLPGLPSCGLAVAFMAGLAGTSLPGSAAGTTECRLPGLAHPLVCASVRRALDPRQPAGTQIDVHYAVAPAVARNKLADPLFVIAGGPGQSAIEVAPGVVGLLQRLNNRRDLVFVDQRGTGRSAALRCPDDDPPAGTAPPAPAADLAAEVARIDTCRVALGALPFIRGRADLGFFTTSIAMQDLDAVRRALGAERINLLGVSYGTRAALDYARQFPAAVRRSVLDAVVPPDIAPQATAAADTQAAWDALVAACARESRCLADHPTLAADWKALLARLPEADDSATPPLPEKPIAGAATPGRQRPWTRERLRATVRGALYVPAVAAALPFAVDEAAHGRSTALDGIEALIAGSRHAPRIATGMHFAVACAEDLPLLFPPQPGNGRAADPPAADFDDAPARLYRRVCAGWPRGDVPAAFRLIAPSATPVLLLSGGLDPAAPPRHAERVAGALGAQARHVIVANAGHGVMGIGCARDVIFRFIDAATDAEARAVDASCLGVVPRPPSFRPPIGDRPSSSAPGATR
jgi:pimeloyl-ACP methyl ester carboxylesterase